MDQRERTRLILFSLNKAALNRGVLFGIFIIKSLADVRRYAGGLEFEALSGVDMLSKMVHHYVMQVIPNYKSPFSKFVKKAHKPLQLAIEDEVEVVCKNPEIGESKVGDLAGIWVHKFKFNRQQYLVAYRPPTLASQRRGMGVELLMIDFYQVGLHENFYDELKRYLKAEGEK